MINSGLMSSNSDCWETPQELFDELNQKYNFDVDVCALPENAKCTNYFTPEIDGLKQEWIGTCWMNPPYGREIGKWMKKAYESSLNGAKVVCLVPARTDTAWWHDYAVNGEIEFIRGRLKFGDSKNSAPFPSAIVVFGGELSKSAKYYYDNEVIMDLVPALAINLKDFDAHDILSGKLWRISEKIDGVRRLFFKDKQGRVSCYSRTGKRDLWLGHITSYLEDPWFPSNIVYDTELVDTNLYFSNEESFILRSETSSKASQQFPDNKLDLSAICFDIFGLDGDLTKGEDREILLTKLFGRSALRGPIFKVPVYGILDGADTKSLTYLMDGVKARKREGLMLMNLDTPYIPGRSSELVKVKRAEEFIGRVIDMEYGEAGTKIEGGISALICEVQGCTVPVRVGSGLTNAERQYFVENPPIGELVEIDAFSRSRDKHGNVSLSMPIFKSLVAKKGI